jgi:dihydrofolate reductase
MRKLIEITFMSLDGVMDAPDLVQAVQPYFQSSTEHDEYQKRRLLAADALLLGRKSYENLSQAYLAMAEAGEGAPLDFVARMNSIPKYVASTTLKAAKWNATVIQGDIAQAVRSLKEKPGKDIVKYGTGPLDRVLFAQQLVDLLCIILYPVILGHGTHLFEDLQVTKHMTLSDVQRFANGTVVLEYVPVEA